MEMKRLTCSQQLDRLGEARPLRDLAQTLSGNFHKYFTVGCDGGKWWWLRWWWHWWWLWRDMMTRYYLEWQVYGAVHHSAIPYATRCRAVAPTLWQLLSANVRKGDLMLVECALRLLLLSPPKLLVGSWYLVDCQHSFCVCKAKINVDRSTFT